MRIKRFGFKTGDDKGSLVLDLDEVACVRYITTRDEGVIVMKSGAEYTGSSSVARRVAKALGNEGVDSD